MKKLAILSTFVFAFGAAMLVTAPTADARPCVCEDQGDGTGVVVCCDEFSADNPDPTGAVNNLDPENEQLTCGAIWLDGDNFIAGRIASDESGSVDGADGCIKIGGNPSQEPCEEAAVAACKRGGESCLGGPTHGDECQP